MASTVSKATFTSKITESITLNNHPKKLETTLTISDVTDYSHRIMSVATSKTTLVNLESSDAAGAFDSARLQYIRITNLDDTNSIQLSFVLTSSNHNYEVLLGPKKSHILTNKQGASSTTGADAVLEDIASIKGKSSTAACDIEIFTVSI